MNALLFELFNKEKTIARFQFRQQKCDVFRSLLQTQSQLWLRHTQEILLTKTKYCMIKNRYRFVQKKIDDGNG